MITRQMIEEFKNELPVNNPYSSSLLMMLENAKRTGGIKAERAIIESLICAMKEVVSLTVQTMEAVKDVAYVVSKFLSEIKRE